MKLDDDHLYHGGALIQIAEHDKFTAINSLKVGNDRYTNAYRINDDVAVYFKYSSKPKKPHDEYVFTFKSEHLIDLKDISKHCRRAYIALVCVGDREICCLNSDELFEMIESRKKAKGGAEDQYTVLVTAPAGKSLRAYVNAPGAKGKILGDSLKIPRNLFPEVVFA